ncbi:hypothetical protein BaRGS_00026451 [Batillaria attramentaria]|uniref:G-protein coupled receptors family 1 profile domain-containing protein n=1 Tax=Batillaria attramentaria TaxID=370345 RepID=A0ABD0K616_9CAEN
MPIFPFNTTFPNTSHSLGVTGTWRFPIPGLSPESFLPPSLSPQLLAILMALYALVAVGALLANVLVVVVVVRARMLCSFTDTFILSLAVSDLLVAGFNMPIRLLSTINNEWRLGLAACRLTEYLQGVTIVNNILTLTAIAINRYLVICREQLHRRVNGRKWTVLSLLGVWAVSLVAVIPQLLVMSLDMRIKRNAKGEILGLAWVCVEKFSDDRHRQTYTVYIYACLYLLPMCVMGFAYGAIGRRLWTRRHVTPAPTNPNPQRLNIPQPGLTRRRRVTVMLVTLVVTFTLLWLPFFSASLYMEFNRGVLEPGFRQARAFLQLVGYSTCCVNPIIYTFLNRKFQDQLWALCCRPHRVHVAPTLDGIRHDQRLDDPVNHAGDVRHQEQTDLHVISLEDSKKQTRSASTAGDDKGYKSQSF